MCIEWASKWAKKIVVLFVLRNYFWVICQQYLDLGDLTATSKFQLLQCV